MSDSALTITPVGSEPAASVAPEVLFMGLDAGGTRCRARIRDASGRLLGEGEAGPANARRGSRAAMDAMITLGVK